MRKILFLVSFLIVIISGCGVNKDEVAKSMKEKIEKGDYDGAKEIYEETNKDLKEDKKSEVDEAIAKMLQEQLVDEFKQVKKEYKETEKFLKLNDFVKSIGLKNDDIEKKFADYNNELTSMKKYIDLKEHTKIDEYPKILEKISNIPTNSIAYKDKEKEIKFLRDNSNTGIKQLLEPLIKQKNIKEFFNQADKLHAQYKANSPAQKEYVQNVHQILKDNDTLFRETLNELVNSNGNDVLSILKQIEQWKPELFKEYEGKMKEVALQKAQENINAHFNMVKDDFEGKTYYIPKGFEADWRKVDLSKSKQVFYPIIKEGKDTWSTNKDEIARHMYFAIGVKQEEWLFLSSISMSIDGEIISGITAGEKIKRDVSSPFIYESDITVATVTEKQMLQIVNGKNVVIRYNGKNKNTPDKVLSQEEKNVIKYAWDFAKTK